MNTDTLTPEERELVAAYVLAGNPATDLENLVQCSRCGRWSFFTQRTALCGALHRKLATWLEPYKGGMTGLRAVTNAHEAGVRMQEAFKQSKGGGNV